MSTRLSIIIAALLTLVACSGGNVPREEGGAGEAEGEVLGGSISDEMLPLDSLKSQSPPLKVSPTSTSDSETADESEEAAEAPEKSAEPTLPAEEG